MDIGKTGELLCSLRKEKGMTQKRAAEILQVSDRTGSKWERGGGSAGCISVEGDFCLIWRGY